VNVVNTDFDDSSEYITSVTVGSQSMSFTHYDKAQDCSSISKILDSVAVPSSRFSGSGQGTVSIQTSSAVNIACGGNYLYAEGRLSAQG
jgi:hypothetical protein